MASSLYDTPPSATKKGGWFSKFIDPAARLIVSLASIFGKNIDSIQEIPQANSAPQIREQREDFVDIKLLFQYNGTSMSEQELSSHFDDIFQLEHLVHQNYFTKEEIDRLDRLIHSRVIEPGNLLLQGIQNKKNVNGDSNANSEENLDDAVSLSRRPTDFGSDDMIQRPYCRSALCRRISCSSRRDKNADLIRPLKWRRLSQFNARHFVHKLAVKRSRSDWDGACSGDGQTRVRQKSCLFS